MRPSAPFLRALAVQGTQRQRLSVTADSTSPDATGSPTYVRQAPPRASAALATEASPVKASTWSTARCNIGTRHPYESSAQRRPVQAAPCNHGIAIACHTNTRRPTAGRRTAPLSQPQRCNQSGEDAEPRKSAMQAGRPQNFVAELQHEATRIAQRRTFRHALARMLCAHVRAQPEMAMGANLATLGFSAAGCPKKLKDLLGAGGRPAQRHAVRVVSIDAVASAGCLPSAEGLSINLSLPSARRCLAPPWMYLTGGGPTLWLRL
jgi:hypothetical protein